MNRARPYFFSTALPQAAAAAALREGDCDVAGLHIPIGPMEDMALAHYRPWLSGMALSLVDIATRRQGLMVRPGNPKELYSLADLTRPSVRFINRQVGSGTRLLLEGLLKAQDIATTRIAGLPCTLWDVRGGKATARACLTDETARFAHVARHFFGQSLATAEKVELPVLGD
mgnify:CR=1 FL=1